MRNFLWAFASLLVACVVQPTTPKPSPAQELKADWSKAEYTAMLKSALETHGQPLLIGKHAGACGERLPFYVMLFSSLARYESSFNPKATYLEKFPDAKGNRVLSQGLFQLSKESANQARYGCGINKPEELLDPKTNIVCAVKIATELISQNGVVAGGSSGAWKGMARYWSPFRDSAKRKAIFTKAESTCK